MNQEFGVDLNVKYSKEKWNIMGAMFSDFGDFKIKKGVFVDGQGTASLGQGDGNHPLAGKSGYFGGLVKHSPFNWGERPDAIDPQNWLAGV